MEDVEIEFRKRFGDAVGMVTLEGDRSADPAFDWLWQRAGFDFSSHTKIASPKAVTNPAMPMNAMRLMSMSNLMLRLCNKQGAVV